MAENGELLFLLCSFLTVSALLQCACTFQFKRHPHTRHKHKHKDSGSTGVLFFDVMAAKKRVRYSIDMVFPSEEEKDRFKQRMDDLKTLLSPPGATKHEKIENTQLIFELFELAESQALEFPAAPQTVPQTGSFLQKAGMSVSVIS